MHWVPGKMFRYWRLNNVNVPLVRCETYTLNVVLAGESKIRCWQLLLDMSLVHGPPLYDVVWYSFMWNFFMEICVFWKCFFFIKIKGRDYLALGNSRFSIRKRYDSPHVQSSGSVPGPCFGSYRLELLDS